jgi:hypothetical protein
MLTLRLDHRLQVRLDASDVLQEAYEIALYHNLGALPEPFATHKFL